MNIISFHFVVLTFIAAFIFYLLAPKYRVPFLVILSCSFIASFSYILLLYILFYTCINYVLALKIPESGNKVLLFRIGLIYNLTQLIILRYANFALDPVFQLFGSSIHISKLSEIILPVGISYFTLQGIGYLINVKMGWEKPERNFVDFLLYITFYPKFLSGPIERSNHFLPQIKRVTSFNEQQVSSGLRITLLGFFKKIVIANQLAPFVMGSYTDLSTTNGTTLWLLLFIQPLYLYFDFSGYTDIVIGIAQIFGINLLPNFNRPFFSENVTTFWKKFHISLSSWFNDYVFKQTSFRYRNWGIFAPVWAMLVTWTLFGIWHGAGWNFMFLGMLQAMAILYEFFTKKWRGRLFSRMPEMLRLWIGRLLTYMFYGASLVFFFSPDLKSGFRFFPELFKGGKIILQGERIELFFFSLAMIAIFMASEVIENDYLKIYERIRQIWFGTRKRNRVFRWVLYFLAITMIIVFNNEVQEFIYFKF